MTRSRSPRRACTGSRATDRRFDGYSFFDLHPEIPIEWFDKHIN